MIDTKGLPTNECVVIDGNSHDCWAYGGHVSRILIYPVESVASHPGEIIRVCSYWYNTYRHPVLEEIGVFE